MTRLELLIAGAAICVASFFVGFFVGVATRPSPSAASPGSTPAACVRALDLAGEGFAAAGDAVDAARRGDSYRADAANDRLESLAGDAAEANRACRAGGR